MKTGVESVGVLPYDKQPGPSAMAGIAAILVPICPEVKIINVEIDQDRADGWDAADALNDGWTAEKFLAWATPRTLTATDAIVASTPKPVDHVAELKAAIAVLKEEWRTADGDRKITLLAAVMSHMILVDAARQEITFAELTEATGMNRGALNNVFYAKVKEKKTAEKDAAPKREYKTLGEGAFTLLGYEGNQFHYLPDGGQVVSLSPSGHNSMDLNMLANYEYWKRNFADEDKGVIWPVVAAQLIEEQRKIGIFDTSRIRGRGPWWDDALGVVFHAGDRLIINGQPVCLTGRPEGHIYPCGLPLNVSSAAPLSVDEALKFLNICGLLPLSRGATDARLLAGWCVCAVVCGALKWRPHMWITGARGSGKSYVLDEVIKRILGDLAVGISGSSSEAGIRQTLGYDALPVVVDEFESSSVAGNRRIAAILEFARQASSGARIIKGGADGRVKAFNAKSSFLLSSIKVSMSEAADTSRVTVIDVAVNKSTPQTEREERYKLLKEAVARDLGGDFPDRFRARAIAMIPVIRANAETFAQAVAAEVGNRRAGDQLGTLLAGAYSLISDVEIAYADALRIVREQDLKEHRENATDSDEINVLNLILQAVVKVQAKSGYSTTTVDRSVGDLILISSGATDDVTYDGAQQALLLIGIKRDAERFVIADSHRGIAKLLAGTKFENGGWGRLLARLPGAERIGSIRIGQTKGRAVSLPVGMVA